MKTALAVLALILVVGTSVAFGRWTMKPTVDELLERNNAIADTFQARIDTLTGVLEERGRTVKDQEELLDSLSIVNAEWAARLQSQERTILGLQRSYSRLAVKFEDQAPVVTDTATGVTLVAIDERQEEDEDNWIRIHGDVSIAPEADSADVNLEVEAEATMTTVITRLPSGELGCEARSGLPPFKINALHCIDNLGDPIADMTRPSITAQMFTPGGGIMAIGGSVLGLLIGLAVPR